MSYKGIYLVFSCLKFLQCKLLFVLFFLQFGLNNLVREISQGLLYVLVLVDVNCIIELLDESPGSFLCDDCLLESRHFAGVINKQIFIKTGLGSRSRVFLAPWSRSRSRLKKNQEPQPEPIGKKVRSRSQTAKRLAGSSALREDKK